MSSVQFSSLKILLRRAQRRDNSLQVRQSIQEIQSLDSLRNTLPAANPVASSHRAVNPRRQKLVPDYNLDAWELSSFHNTLEIIQQVANQNFQIHPEQVCQIGR